MKNLFVPQPLAKLADEKQFNEPCFAAWYPDHEEIGWFGIAGKTLRNSEMLGGAFTAPLYQQLVDWFREKHNIHVIPCKDWSRKDRPMYSAMLANENINQDMSEMMRQRKYTTYYEALTAALTEAFKLI
jgi:hypothetical protein